MIPNIKEDLLQEEKLMVNEHFQQQDGHRNMGESRDGHRTAMRQTGKHRTATEHTQEHGMATATKSVVRISQTSSLVKVL